jgi:hypothetical protein
MGAGIQSTQPADYEMFAGNIHQPQAQTPAEPEISSDVHVFRSKKLHPKDIHAVPGEIESRLGYSPQKGKVEKKTGWCFHRKDYHEDGSISEFYGVELTREQFLSIGGVELSIDPTLNTAPDATTPTIPDGA